MANKDTIFDQQRIKIFDRQDLDGLLLEMIYVDDWLFGRDNKTNVLYVLAEPRAETVMKKAEGK